MILFTPVGKPFNFIVIFSPVFGLDTQLLCTFAIASIPHPSANPKQNWASLRRTACFSAFHFFFLLFLSLSFRGAAAFLLRRGSSPGPNYSIWGRARHCVGPRRDLARSSPTVFPMGSPTPDDARVITGAESSSPVRLGVRL